VSLPGGGQVPLRELAEIDYTTGPAKISRDNTRRRVVVSVNVRNRDLQSVVTDIEGILGDRLDLPPGYYIDYGGQFENLQNASRRLKIAVPIALLLIFIFLHFAFQSFKEAGLVFTAIPLSIVGGVFLLWIRGMPFSISAGIGFIALFGVAVLNGIVLIEHLKDLKKEGITDMRERVLKGTRERLRPVMLTAAAAALGFLPMAVSTSAGAEVQRPLATVVIGGLVTSTLLTMLALPLLYSVIDEITGIRLWPPKFIRGKAAGMALLLLVPALAMSQPFTAAAGPAGVQPPRTLNLEDVLEIAYNCNSELAAYGARVQEQESLVRSAFSIDRTSIYYSYDENNIAENGHPIGVFGGEQRFDFPTLYTAQRKANLLSASMAGNELEKQKRILARDVSKAFYSVVYLQDKIRTYSQLDSIYDRYSRAAEEYYVQGEQSYLELLNARAERDHVALRLNSLEYDLQTAVDRLAALMNYDSLFRIPETALPRLEPVPAGSASDPGLKYLQNSILQQEASVNVEKNRMLPDITLGYFNGTNRFAGSMHYQGVEVGIGIPLFFSEQRSRIRAERFALDAAVNLQAHYIRQYDHRVNELMNGIRKYEKVIHYYDENGKKLARELSAYARRVYAAGEIDFFRFVQSMDNAIEIEIEYLDTLFEYNKLVLDVNFLTL
jgi:cobalt-zinc-cadmium resistance protein CzcA